MRNSTVPAPGDPYTAVHQLGHRRQPVARPRSRPGPLPWRSSCRATGTRGWAAYDANGLLRIGFFDRSYDPANHQYGYTLATETASGTLAFGTTELTTARSDPTKNDRWFAATVKPAFPFATTFLGDYSGIAAKPGGGVVAVWTDMRGTVSFAGRTGADQDVEFAAAP